MSCGHLNASSNRASPTRGCEYRVIQIATEKWNVYHPGVEITQGFLLPEIPGDAQRYAICSNGLITPVITIGDKRDLRNSILTRLEVQKGMFYEIEVALLLRLGEGDLASQYWEKMYKREPDREKGYIDPYFELARDYALYVYNAAALARNLGDDETALYHFRKLAALTKKVNAEAKNRGFKRTDGTKRLSHKSN